MSFTMQRRTAGSMQQLFSAYCMEGEARMSVLHG